MRIYQLSVLLAQEGSVVSYHASKRKAQAEARTAKGGDEKDAVQFYTITPINFKPTKAGILQMLNHFTPVHDNG